MNISDNSTQQILDMAINALEDIKAKDIIVLDTTKHTSLFNYLIVASGDSNRQVRALAKNVEESLKHEGIEIIGTEGLDSGDWALVDAGDVVVHVMLPAVRDYYDIEALWGGEKPSLHADGLKPWEITER